MNKVNKNGKFNDEPDTSTLMQKEDIRKESLDGLDVAAEESSEDEREGITPFRIAISILAVLILVLTAAFYTCDIRTVEVLGNTLYTADEIKDLVINDDSMVKHNSLYLPIYNLLPIREQIPFVKGVKVETTGLHSVRITVSEKDFDAYIPYEDNYLYITYDGIVQEISPYTVIGTTYVGGLDVTEGITGKKIVAEDGRLVLLLDALSCLRKYEVSVDGINIESKGDISIYFDEIRVELGRSDYELKISKVAQLIPYLEGRSGTIDMSSYSSSGENIILK